MKSNIFPGIMLATNSTFEVVVSYDIMSSLPSPLPVWFLDLGLSLAKYYSCSAFLVSPHLFISILQRTPLSGSSWVRVCL